MSHQIGRLFALLLVAAAAAVSLPAAASAADAPPTCPGGLSISLPWSSPALAGCSDATSVSVVRRPAHGHLDTWGFGTIFGAGYGGYFPTAGYVGSDSYTIAATNDKGTSTLTVNVLVSDPTSATGVCSPESGSTNYARVQSTRTSLVLCRTATDVRAAPPTFDNGGQSAGSVTVGAATQATLFGSTFYVYPVRYTTPSSADRVGDTVTTQLTFGLPTSSPTTPLKFTLEGATENHDPSCSSSGGGPFGSAVGVNMSTQALFCSDPDGDRIAVSATVTRGTLTQVLDGLATIFTAPATPAADDAKLTGTYIDVPDGVTVAPAPAAQDLGDIFFDVQAPHCTPTTTLTTAHDAAVEQPIDCGDAVSVVPVSTGFSQGFSAAQHGMVDVSGTGADRRMTYTPDPGFSGTDEFILATAPAGGGTLEPTRVTVTVTPPPPAEQPVTQPAAQPPAPAPATPVVSEKARVLALIKAKGLAAVLKSLKQAFAKGRTSATVGPFTYDASIAIRLTGTLPKASSAAKKKKKKAKAKVVKLGSGKLSLFKHRKATLKLSLTKAAKRALKRNKKLKVTVAVTMEDPATGAKASAKRALTIKVKAKKKKKK